ncbi:MAG: inositol monophosphatase [archaeon]
MKEVYDEIVEFMLSSGKRLVEKAGSIKNLKLKDNEVTEDDYVTEEDIRIERGFKEIVLKYNPNHEFYAEEEHDNFPDADNVWVSDPISGTNRFVEGDSRYSIVIAHLNKGIIQFGAVYAPALNELYTAYRGEGAFLNGKKISVSQGKKTIIFRKSHGWMDEESQNKSIDDLAEYDLSSSFKGSFAISLCHAATGKYDGIVLLCKDTFPIYAGAIILDEAGGIFTNNKGDISFSYRDRVFVGGNKEFHKELKKVLNKTFP